MIEETVLLLNKPSQSKIYRFRLNFFKIFLLSLLLFANIISVQSQKTIDSYKTDKSEQTFIDGDIVLPTPTGKYRVGRASFHRTDASRPETFTDDASDHREVLFHIWYPAEATGGTTAQYIDLLPDNEIFVKSYAFVGIERLLRTHSHSLTGVKVSGSKKRYPVVVFSHGLGTVSALYAAILENLASHGYIVVGVDSPFFSAALKMPDGRIIRNQSQRNKRKGAREEEAVIQAQDLIFVLNELEGLNKSDPDKRFTGRLDLKRVGVFGHSRGGFAAPHACLLDNRFRACLNLDGYSLTPAVMEKGIRQPYMHIEEIAPWLPPLTDEELVKAKQTRQEADKEAQDAERERETTFGKMSSGVYLVTVKGATHNSFSNAPFISPDRYTGMTISPERALTITNAYVLAFFERCLRGSQEPLLKGVAPQFPEATLEIYRLGKQSKKLHSSKEKSE